MISNFDAYMPVISYYTHGCNTRVHKHEQLVRERKYRKEHLENITPTAFHIHRFKKTTITAITILCYPRSGGRAKNKIYLYSRSGSNNSKTKNCSSVSEHLGV